MILQSAALAAIAQVPCFATWGASMVLLGVGTAMVYPTLLGAVGDFAPPSVRASALGVFRFWRDLGFALGALGAGIVADFAGLAPAIQATAVVTFLSGLWVAFAFRDRRSNPEASRRRTS